MTGAQEITKHLGGHWRGRYGMARCPCHRDRTPSLKVTDGLDGELLLHCFGGCGWRDVKDTLRRDGLLPERGVDNGNDRDKKAPFNREIAERQDAADRADMYLSWSLPRELTSHPGEMSIAHRAVSYMPFMFSA